MDPAPPLRRALLAVALLAVAACGAPPAKASSSTPPGAQKIEVSLPVEEMDLPNGLHVVFHPLKTAPCALVYVRYEVGSTGSLASFLGRGIARGTSPATILSHDLAVDNVTAENVQSAANQYLAADATVVVIIGDASKLTGLAALGLGEPQIVR